MAGQNRQEHQQRKMREGRGRLSAIDKLPAEADPHIHWATVQLAERERSQADILFELNDRLVVIGCEPVSRSAFNRYSTRRANAVRRLTETREVAAAVAETLGPEKADNVTVMIVQLIKEAAFAILEKGDVSTKQVMELSRALQSAVNSEKTSASTSQSKQNRINETKEEAAQTAAEEIVKANPELNGGEILAKIRSAYGIGEMEPQS